MDSTVFLSEASVATKYAIFPSIYPFETVAGLVLVEPMPSVVG
jgi:hypothetical protein